MLTYSTDFKGQASGVGAAITSNTLSVATGNLLTVVLSANDNDSQTAFTISNNGTAISWAQVVQTNTTSNCRQTLWQGVAGATPPTTVTVTTTAGTATTAAKTLFVAVHSGQHATDPVPSGNVYSGTGGTDITQSITPTTSGSCLWMVASDWIPTNSFAAAANCTLEATAYSDSDLTSVPIRPTTQPRTDTTSFTIGETDTGGKIAWVAWEVQAAASAGPNPGPASLTITGFAPTVTNSSASNSYGTSARLPATATTTAANPATFSINCPNGTTVLWLGIVVAGTTARSGGAPTYNGITMSAGSPKTNAGGTPEENAETWYLINPPTGSSFTISVPNSGTLAMTMIAATAAATSGFSTVPAGSSVQTQGNSTNPSTTGPTGVSGDITFAIVGNGATTWNPSARSGTQIYDWDAGTWGLGAQYFNETSTSGSTVSWTFGTSEDWIIEANRFTTIVANPNISVGVGELTVTGFAPTVTALSGTNVAPGAGTLTLSGFSPTANVKYSASPGVGALSITGFAPTANVKQSAAPGVGALTITGFAPTANLKQSAAPGVGALSIAGFAPIANLKQSAAPGFADLTIEGQVPSVTITLPGNVSPGVAALTVDAFAPTVRLTQSAQPGVASLSITATAPTANLSQSAAPGVASLSITAAAPTANLKQSVAPGAGALSVVGFAPSVTVALSGTVQPGAAALDLTSFAPTANLKQSAQPGASAITITGFAPSARVTLSAQPGAAAIVVTGQSPTVSVTAGQTVSAGASALSITGFAPTANLKQSARPGYADILVQGFAPTAQVYDPSVISIGAAALTITAYPPALAYHDLTREDNVAHRIEAEPRVRRAAAAARARAASAAARVRHNIGTH